MKLPWRWRQYIFIRRFALAQGTFLLVIFAWICCDGFESQLRNGYLLKCLFDCNWHIGTIKWETKIDILGWRDRDSNSRPLASRAGALSITLHLIQGYNRHRDIQEIRPHTCIHTYMHASIHTYIHTYIHLCWFDFDALAQGNAYKPTKEPINYRGPGGDRTHDLQTEATPPAASCPARTLHATEIA